MEFPYRIGKPTIIAIVQRKPSDISDLSTNEISMKTSSGYYVHQELVKDLKGVLPRLEREANGQKKAALWLRLAEALITNEGAIHRDQFSNDTKASDSATSHAVDTLNNFLLAFAKNISSVSPKAISLKVPAQQNTDQ